MSRGGPPRDLYADQELESLYDPHALQRDAAAVRGDLGRAFQSVSSRSYIHLALISAQKGHQGDASEYLARAYCARAGVPRGDAPALDVIDHLAPAAADVEVPPLVAAAVQAVRRWELEEMPAEMVPRARIELDPEAWERLQKLIRE